MMMRVGSKIPETWIRKADCQFFEISCFEYFHALGEPVFERYSSGVNLDSEAGLFETVEFCAGK